MSTESNNRRVGFALIVVAIGVLLVLRMRGPSAVQLPAVGATSLGTASYDWQLETLDGQTVDFEDFRGKVVFLNLWATWCPPCRAELPSMQALYEAVDDPNVVFAFVSNEDVDVLAKYKARKKLTIPMYRAGTAPPGPFQTRSIPRTIVIDDDGTIVLNKTGAADWSGEDALAFVTELVGPTP